MPGQGSSSRPPVTAAFDRERVRALSEDCTLLIACWDRGFQAAHHWVNHAALAWSLPALFSEIRATTTLAGPLFIPGRSACWMCYRMRAIACEQDFDRAMAFEEHLDQKRQPGLAGRPILTALPLQLAAMLTLEALKCLIKFNPPTLVDKVLAFDGLLGATQSHAVLVKPYCPVCSKKKARQHPHGAELLREAEDTKRPLHELSELLVSQHSGIITASRPLLATPPSRHRRECGVPGSPIIASSPPSRNRIRPARVRA